MKRKRIFKKSEGYESVVFLQYGLDHCHSGICLYALKDPRTIDSASYLFHLGLEQILKAWHLEVFAEFEDTHSLDNLLNNLISSGATISLSASEKVLFKEIDRCKNIRYPTTSKPIGVGTGDLQEKVDLVNNIFSQMPTSLKDLVSKIDPTRKGGRVLMQKEIDKEQ